MKISEQSLHFRWLTKVGPYGFRRNPPKSLCSYFWTLVAYGFIQPVFVAGLVTLTVGFLGFTGYVVATKFPVEFSSGALTIGAILLIWYAMWKASRNEKPYVYKPQKEKEPNLVVEFLKAKKNKVCPLIEYTD